ncbi:MAG: DNA/RNA nuclease SfsA [candidate division NC10 bacterium]|nr:DNA/RNA nuclease SfsA [candidate division NC10 bacterium]
MPFGSLLPGRFLGRRNRFAAAVAIGGVARLVHVPNSGRLRELLRPGAAVRVRPAPPGVARRTGGDLCLVRHAGRWVCVDNRVAVPVVAAALGAGRAPGLSGWQVLRREVRVGRHRFDLLLRRAGRRALCEVKSVTLVEGGVARFPDAPTARGTAHMKTLGARARRGGAAVVCFLIQRADAAAFAPHAAHDPAFAAACRAAVFSGVLLRAYTCRVTPGGIAPLRRVPVRLGWRERRGSRSCPPTFWP